MHAAVPQALVHLPSSCHLYLGPLVDAMVLPAELKQLIDANLGPNCSEGVNVRMDKILVALKEHGFAYDAALTPAVLGCHPQNRSSSMVNPYDCWHKGSKVLEAGIKASLLPPNSVAIEVGNGAKKAAQVEANKAMVASSQGLLAAWGGGERFLACGCSHMVQWLRAVAAGIHPKGPSLLSSLAAPCIS